MTTIQEPPRLDTTSSDHPSISGSSQPFAPASDGDNDIKAPIPVHSSGSNPSTLLPPIDTSNSSSTLTQPTPGINRSPSPRRNSYAASSSVAYADSPGAGRREKAHAHPLGFLDGSSSDNLPALNTMQSMAGENESNGYANPNMNGNGGKWNHDTKYPNPPAIHVSTRASTPSPFDSDVESDAGWSPSPEEGESPNGAWSKYSPYQALSEKNGDGNYSTFPLSGPGQAYNYPTRDPPPRGWAAFQESSLYWLSLYFFFNLGLTLFNKFVLVSFPFPYTLTGLHALSGCAGCYVALERGAFTPARLTSKENIILAAFSVLYTINIAVSNLSLKLVTVPFHQVVRASTPLFTIFISTIFLRTRFSVMKLVSLLPVVAGVGFATYGDYYFTAWGLILTLLGTFLAALKTVVTNLIQTGGGGRLKLHPLDLLMRMSPLAFIQCVVYGWWSGELEEVRKYGATQMTQSKAVALLVNGMIACGLNIVSFTANKKAGPLTMTVSANCKQVLTIVFAVVLFNLHINFTNAVGIMLTLVGGGWYGWVEFQEKQRKSKLSAKS